MYQAPENYQLNTFRRSSALYMFSYCFCIRSVCGTSPLIYLYAAPLPPGWSQTSSLKPVDHRSESITCACALHCLLLFRWIQYDSSWSSNSISLADEVEVDTSCFREVNPRARCCIDNLEKISSYLRSTLCAVSQCRWPVLDSYSYCSQGRTFFRKLYNLFSTWVIIYLQWIEIFLGSFLKKPLSYEALFVIQWHLTFHCKLYNWLITSTDVTASQHFVRLLIINYSQWGVP